MKTNLGDRIYISTIASDAVELAEKYGLGLEIADFCVGANLDTDFEPYGRLGQEKMKLGHPITFHFPFAELCPCAIDPKVREVVLFRHRQALHFALENGAKRFIIHGGYIPLVYYPQWFVARSVEYWKSFLASEPGDYTIYLENVMEEDYNYMLEVVRGVDDPRFRLCLDIGHCNCVSKQSPEEWVRNLAPWVGHAHIHNNDGVFDYHRMLGDGTADMEKLIDMLCTFAPGCSFAIECMEAESSVLWLKERGYLG